MQPWKFRSCLANLNAACLIGAGETDAAGTEPRMGVAGAGDASRTNWTGVEWDKIFNRTKGRSIAIGCWRGCWGR